MALDPKAVFEFLQQAGLLGALILTLGVVRWVAGKWLAIIEERGKERLERISILEKQVVELSARLDAASARYQTFAEDAKPLMKEVVLALAEHQRRKKP